MKKTGVNRVNLCDVLALGYWLLENDGQYLFSIYQKEDNNFVGQKALAWQCSANFFSDNKGTINCVSNQDGCIHVKTCFFFVFFSSFLTLLGSVLL